jgi:hypothetical protein
MSWLSIAWAEQAPVADVYERAIVTLLAHRASTDGTGAYPSVRYMARFAVCDEKSIERRLRALRERGVISYGDQSLAAHIDRRYRPKVYDLMIPFEWYSGAQIEQVNRERAERGVTPLTPETRPPLAVPEPARRQRSDTGVPRRPAEVEEQPLAADSAQGGLRVPPAEPDSGGSTSPSQGGLLDPSRGVYKTPNTVLKENLPIKTGGVTLVDASVAAAQEQSPPPGNPSEETPGIYDPANPRCREHRRIPAGERGPNCGACARAREWQAEKERVAAAAEAATLRECPMCDSSGQRVDEHRVPLSPYRTCDHSTPTATILAEIAAREAAMERPRAPIELAPASSESVRAAALASVRKRVTRRGLPAGNTPNGFLNPTNSGHTDQVQARTG